MPNLDKRFSLIRDGQHWYAALIEDRDTRQVTFRVSERGKSRDAHKQAEQVHDLEIVVRKVIQEGMRMRCARDGTGQPTTSLDLRSDRVTGCMRPANPS